MRIFKLCFFTMLAGSALLLSGCNRKTPEERLKTAVEFYQQGDPLSAEMEALKVVEKAPEDPAAVQANMLLAQIYASQNRSEEAELQLEAALENVSQLDPMGKDVLKMYLALLNSEKKYKKALETVDKYRKEYAEDDGTSLSLLIVGIDTKTAAGETTSARAELQSVIDQTTEPAEMNLYQQMMLQTYMRDQDTSGAIAYMEQQLTKENDPDARQGIMLGLAGLYAQLDNYEKSRELLEAVTAKFNGDVSKEKDARTRAAMALQLAQAYKSVSNLPGTRRTLQAIYDSQPKDPQLITPTVLGMAETLLMLGDTSGTLSFMEDAAKAYPEAKFDTQIKQLKDMLAKGELTKLAPELTSTMVMKYRNDPNIVWPTALETFQSAEDTSGTATATEQTSGSGTSSASAPAENLSNTTPTASVDPISTNTP